MNTDSLYLDQLKFDPKLKNSFMHGLIKNVRLVILAILALIIAGVGSFLTLPRELNPQVDIPIVNVVTTLPGASPTDVEKLVTKKIETEVSDIATIDLLSSSSSNSVSVITAQFISTEDPDEALDKVREKVDLVTDLPEDASDPRVSKLDFNEQPIWTVAVYGDINRIALTKITEDLADKLEATSDIRRVTLSGELEEEIAIKLKHETLARYQVSPEAITGTIKANNLTLPAGSIQAGQLEYTLSVNNEFTTIDQVRSLPIQVGQSSIALGEIADVYYQTKDTNSLAYNRISNDQRVPTIQLDIYKSNNATISDSVNTAEEILEAEVSQNPSIHYLNVLNQAESVEESFNELGSNFRSTIILVFLLLFTFLGLRQAGIASVSIPLTFLSAFVIMNALGITLNFLSLFSLLLALGLVVDDAIVIVQAANNYGKKFSPVQAGLLVYRDFVVPIWTTTLTTVWAFLPLLLATGIIGEFIKSIPIVVSATLLSSTTLAVLLNIPLTTIFADLKLPPRVKNFTLLLVFLGIFFMVNSLAKNSPLTPLVSLTFITLSILSFISRKQLSKYFSSKYPQLIKKTKSHLKSWAKNPTTAKLIKFKNHIPNINTSDLVNSGLIDFSVVSNRYRKFLEKILRYKKLRYRVYFATAGFVALSFAFMFTGLLKNEFFPATDSENIYINIQSPAGSPVETTEAITERTETLITDIPEIKSIISLTGASFDPDGLGGGASGSNASTIAVTLVKDDQRNRSSIDIADEIRQKVTSIQDAKITVAELSGGPPAGADFQINIKGEELDQLETIANDFMDILGGIEGAINIDTSLKLSSGEVRVNLIPQELQKRGLSAAQVGGWLRTALSGTEASTISLGDKDQDITVTLRDQDQTIDMLQNLPLPSQLGNYTLGEVATLSLENTPVSIVREDSQRVVSVTAAAKGVPSTQILAQFEDKANQYQMPLGYTWDTGGANEENQESVNSILQAMTLSFILILLTMVLQLESFRKAAIVMIVIPLAVAGVFFNFTIFGIPLSFPALIGVLALFGIVVNNSIMLVEKINQNLKQGFKVLDAVVDACSSRLEPIFLTSLTTSAGLLPITLSDPLWRGLGGSIIAGLSVSGILILVLLPTIYIEFFDENK